MLLFLRRVAGVGLVAILAVSVAGPAAAQQGWTALSAEDRGVAQMLLEHETTNTPRPLPSGITMVITRTETSPAVCRAFTLTRGTTEVTGEACRQGPRQWALAGVPRATGRSVTVARNDTADPPAPRASTATVAAAPVSVPQPALALSTAAAAPAAGAVAEGPPAHVLSAREEMRRLLMARAAGEPPPPLEGATAASEAALDEAAYGVASVVGPAGTSVALADASAAEDPTSPLAEIPRPGSRPTPGEADEETLIRLAEAPDVPLPARRPSAEALDDEDVALVRLASAPDVPLPTRRPTDRAEVAEAEVAEAETAEAETEVAEAETTETDTVAAETVAEAAEDTDIPLVRLATVPDAPAPRLRPMEDEAGRLLVRLADPPPAPRPAIRPAFAQGSLGDPQIDTDPRPDTVVADATVFAATLPGATLAVPARAAVDAVGLTFAATGDPGVRPTTAAAGLPARGLDAVIAAALADAAPEDPAAGVDVEVRMTVLDAPPDAPVPGFRPASADATVVRQRLDPPPTAPAPRTRPTAG